MEKQIFFRISIIAFLVITCKGDDEEAMCLDSKHHKDKPSPESNFNECISWEKNSCCDLEISNSIHNDRAKLLYNYHWDKCGTISQACEKYLVHEECFYQCEPQLIQFEKPDDKGAISGVPICASYCQEWFDACKSDLTCVEDWIGHWDYDNVTNENHCPEDQSCVTYEEMYKDAKGLCDKMWGEAFFYAEGENCMVMVFNNTKENPNSDVTPSAAPHHTVPALTLLAFALMLLATF